MGKQWTSIKWFILQGTSIFTFLPQFHYPTTILPSYLHYFTILPQFYPPTTISTSYHSFTLLPQWYENVANLSVIAIQTNTLQFVEQDVYPVQAVCCVVHSDCSDMPHMVSHKFYPPPAIKICSANHSGLSSIRPVKMSVKYNHSYYIHSMKICLDVLYRKMDLLEDTFEIPMLNCKELQWEKRMSMHWIQENKIFIFFYLFDL